MKELYISPELHVLCFAPQQQLANDDDLDLGLNLGGLNPETSPGGDDDFGLDIL